MMAVRKVDQSVVQKIAHSVVMTVVWLADQWAALTVELMVVRMVDYSAVQWDRLAFLKEISWRVIEWGFW
jgi:hypothetical protein